MADCGYYLLPLCREEIVRLFYLRNNEPMEFRTLRLALEAMGVKADHQDHWESLSTLLKQRGKEQLLDEVETANAVAARLDPKNRVVCLTPEMYALSKMMAEKRGWPVTQKTQAFPQYLSSVPRPLSISRRVFGAGR